MFLTKERKHFGGGLHKDYYLKSASSDQLLILMSTGRSLLVSEVFVRELHFITPT
jgi:hypothetical protein